VDHLGGDNKLGMKKRKWKEEDKKFRIKLLKPIRFQANRFKIVKSFRDM